MRAKRGEKRRANIARNRGVASEENVFIESCCWGGMTDRSGNSENGTSAEDREFRDEL
jgi:hypothetical protein